jgi:uncharacterized protein DUF4375
LLELRRFLESILNCRDDLLTAPRIMFKGQILINLSASDKTKFGKEDFASQSLPQKVFSALWSVESEVNNGGFWQYFFKDGNETAWFLVEALEIIGAPKTAEICKQAIATAFPAGLPETSEAIRSAVTDFSDEILKKLELLTQHFFAYPDNLTDLLFVYVSEHPEEFGTLPKPDDA